MIAVTTVALLLFVARFGYWPCILACGLAGSLLVAVIPAFLFAAPRYLCAIGGAVGAFLGCWLGSFATFHLFEQPTMFMTTVEYSQFHGMHQLAAYATIPCAILAGGLVGLGVYALAIRNATSLNRAPTE